MATSAQKWIALLTALVAAGCDGVPAGRVSDTSVNSGRDSGLLLTDGRASDGDVADAGAAAGPDTGIELVPGTEDANEDQFLCKTCLGPEHCGGEPNYCVTSNHTGEMVCGRDCSADPTGCPDSYECLALPLPTGGMAHQCLPVASTCQKLPDLPEPTEGSCGTATETAVFNLVNQERVSRGLNALKCDPAALHAAHAYSQQMCDTGHFDHIGPDGRGPGQRLSAAGGVYQAVGENIARGALTPAAAVQAWLGSPGHRTNMLSPQWTHTGVGHVACQQGYTTHYWTQLFLLR